MRSLGTRRAVLVAGAATVAAVALAGCSAGQVAETALIRPSNQGVNADNANGTVGIRDFAVPYNSPQGYPAGGDAPIEGGLYNLTNQPVTVLISSAPSADSVPNAEIVWARQIGIVGGAGSASPSAGAAVPSGSAMPSGAAPSGAVPSGAVPSGAAPSGAAPSGSAPPTPAGAEAQPARFSLPPSGNILFNASDPQQLRAIGLSGRLQPGQSVNLVFEFSNGAPPLILPVSVSTPETPIPRGPVNTAENQEPEGSN